MAGSLTEPWHSAKAEASKALTSATAPLVNPAPPIIKRFTLTIAPAQADVTVDDKVVTANDGKVDVEGVVGATPRVKLSYGGKSEEFLVAIAETGVFPARLDLAVAQAVKPNAKPAVGSSKRASNAAPTPAPAAAKPPEARPVKKDTDLNRNVDEFGK